MLICYAETSCAFFVCSSNRKILYRPRNYDLASNSFKKAIDKIDKSIDHLQKTKDALVGTDLLILIVACALSTRASSHFEAQIQSN